MLLGQVIRRLWIRKTLPRTELRGIATISLEMPPVLKTPTEDHSRDSFANLWLDLPSGLQRRLSSDMSLIMYINVSFKSRI